MKNSLQFIHILSFIIAMIVAQHAQGFDNPLPSVKKCDPATGTILLTSVSIVAKDGNLQNEKRILQEILVEHQIPVLEGRLPISLEITSFTLPRIASSYRDKIEQQGYRLSIGDDAIRIQSPSAAGIFYGVQTLAQLIDANHRVPTVDILDFPDVAVRMVMVDPARQNENMDYYRRLIRFCARYKINAILVHLTDDQTACLAHEDYPWLMHPQAWSVTQIKDLVAFAKRYHIELIPEIESFGHSRMFVRDPDFREILHQTRDATSSVSWLGTNVPGYTNVLCPASDKAYEYLDKMYERAAQAFTYPLIHIGCDEVDMTRCARCEKKFPGISQSQWFLNHLLRCREIAAKHGRKIALWGDMLLSHPDIVEGLPPENTVIYDWHYNADVSADSSAFFKKHGFEVIGCPALVCSPHMILPDEHNYANIRRFAEIARQNDLLGINTTIWVPTRYMSDALWLGIAFAAGESWCGSQWDEASFYSAFMRDFFDSAEGPAFARAWTDLSRIVWHRQDFNTGCWIDEESLRQAATLATSREKEIRANVENLRTVRNELKRIGAGIAKNRHAWDAIERSAALLSYTMEHLLASRSVRADGKWNKKAIERLDQSCAEAITWVEEDWDRNRFPNDPNKDGIYLPDQNLLFRFKQMHNFHQEILRTISAEEKS